MSNRDNQMCKKCEDKFGLLRIRETHAVLRGIIDLAHKPFSVIDVSILNEIKRLERLAHHAIGSTMRREEKGKEK